MKSLLTPHLFILRAAKSSDTCQHRQDCFLLLGSSSWRGYRVRLLSDNT